MTRHPDQFELFEGGAPQGAPPANLVIFKPAWRTGFVRRFSVQYADRKTERGKKNLWRVTVNRIATQLAQFNLDETQILAELDAFRDAVCAELTGIESRQGEKP